VRWGAALQSLVVAVVLALSGVAAPAVEGVVTHVSDGDTGWVRPDGRRARPVKVRLIGIDAPERCQAWGAQATAALQRRVLHQHVVVPTRGHDDYGRTLGGLRLADGEDISAWMVAQGHAWNYRSRRHGGPYAALEQRARSARRGLFANTAALPPRRFRQSHGPCDSPRGKR
jgi:endonuclease YncB( thermonuclease family)